MPMGPITLFDVVGLDTAFYAGRVMYEPFPTASWSRRLCPRWSKPAGLGKNRERVFCVSRRQRAGRARSGTESQLLEPMLRGKQKFSEEQITARLFLPMLLEATRLSGGQNCARRARCRSGLIFGLGFPPFKGGLLFWADTLGAAKIVEMLKPLESLGERLKPTPMLVEMAADRQEVLWTKPQADVDAMRLYNDYDS